jgi:hypothetical protein
MTTFTLEELSALELIRRLKGSYSYLLDTKQWDEWRKLFTDDFHWATEGGMAMDGADPFVEMTRSFIGAIPTVHQFHAPVLDLLSPTTATGLWPMFDYVGFPDSPIQGYGYYHETYRLEADGWKISTQFLSRLRVDDVAGLGSGVTATFSPLDVTTAATDALPTLA